MGKVTKRLLAFIMTMVLTISLFVPVIQVSAASISLSKTKIVIVVGQNYKLKLNGTKKSPTWKTSNKKVVTVNQKGVVTGVSKGTANVTATLGKNVYKCKVTVEAPKISATKKTIGVGDTFTLKLNGTTRTAKWASSNKNVAIVNQKGVVKAVSKGTANIVANIGGKKYVCKVTVTKPRLLSVSTNELTITNKGTIIVTFKGNGSVYYDTDDYDIISCKWGGWDGYDTKLYVTALKYGKAKITITNDNNNEKYVIKVNANKPHTHKYGAWTITVPATEKKEGTKVRKCTICGNVEKAAVVAGEMFSRPLSGQSNKVIKFKEYSWEPERKIKINVKNVITGENANKLAKSENSFNEDPQNGYTWKFFIIDVEFISSSDGYSDSISGSDIIWSDNIYSTEGVNVGVKDRATLGDKYSEYDVSDVELHPGSKATMVYGVLVQEKYSKLVLKIPNITGATWVSLKAPELSSDEIFGKPAEPDSLENIAAYAIAITKAKLKNESTFELHNVVYKDSWLVYDYYTEEFKRCPVVIIWYSAANGFGGITDGYTWAWYSDEMMSGISSDQPYYNIDQSNGGYVVVEMSDQKPSTFTDYVSISAIDRVSETIGEYHYTAQWLSFR